MKSRYSERQLSWLQTWYRHWKVPRLTRRFNLHFNEHRSETAIRSVLHNHGFCCGRPCGNAAGTYRIFTEAQAAFIRRNIGKYNHTEIALRLNRRYRANFTGEQIHSFTANRRIDSGRTGYFPKGHVPWNAGTKGLMKPNSGNFKKGHIPANHRPIRSKRIDSKDGYVLIKVRERNPYTGTPTRFKLKHVILWEKRHGPVPKGKIIIFRDGNKYNFRPENLVCISRSEHARLNQMHYQQNPGELKPCIFALAKLKARIGELKNGKKKR